MHRPLSVIRETRGAVEHADLADEQRNKRAGDITSVLDVCLFTARIAASLSHK